jgi:guanosine-3',5'-bis(diphosphate) 3'-pyrophosphohydrolase
MSSLLLKAIAFAADKHRNQRRKDADASPYINHPIALANTLANEGNISGENTLCAAILHDTIEDTETTRDELVANFGEKIASIVMEVTDNKDLPKAERKLLQIEHAAHASYEAKLVKLADKICNLRDLLSTPPQDWPKERLADYFEWANKVVAGVRGVNPELEAIFDQLMIEGRISFS